MSHVFISYVRENEENVRRLCETLEICGIKVWRDKTQIRPGYRWADAVRHAISEGAFFIACFSAQYIQRNKSYMNEELTLAIEELRRRPINRAWFIPVLLSPCEIPDRRIGAGETLRDIQWVALYENWDDGVKQILSVIQPESLKIHGLLEFLSSPSAPIRVGAIEELSKLGVFSKEIIPALTTALQDKSESVRAAASEALYKLSLPARNFYRLTSAIGSGELNLNDPGAKRSAYEELIGMGEYVVPVLIEALSGENRQASIFAYEMLRDIGEKASLELAKALTPEVNGLNIVILQLLEKMGNRAQVCIPFLIQLLKDENTGLHARTRTASILGRLGASAAIPALTETLSVNDLYPLGLCAIAADALGEIGDPVALQALLNLAQDENKYYYSRVCAIKAIGKLGRAAKSVTPALQHLLTNHSDGANIYSEAISTNIIGALKAINHQ